MSDDSQKSDSKKISVDAATCIGCGICVSLAPEIFEMNEDGKSVVRSDVDLASENLEKAQESADACPVDAITVDF